MSAAPAHEAPYDLHGKKAKRVWFVDEESLTATDSRMLIFTINYHGDRDECWIVQQENGVEVARHNCKYIATIEWLL